MNSQMPEKTTKKGIGPFEIIVLIVVIGLGLGSVIWAFFGPWSQPVEEELLASCIQICDQEVACETERGDKGHGKCVEVCVRDTREHFSGCVEEVVALNYCLAQLSCQALEEEEGCQPEIEAMQSCRE